MTTVEVFPKVQPAQEDDTNLLRSLSDEQREQLQRYLDALLLANKKFNLTAVRDPNDAWQRHVIESLRLLPLLETAASLMDVGSGGGLPGMVLAIARPDIMVTLLEATSKKAHFLSATAEELGLKNLRVLHERAEVAASPGSAHREHFDVVSARAVAPLPTLLELCSPFLKIGGTLLAIKGEKAHEELTQATRAMRLLMCRLKGENVQDATTVLLIEKFAPTPAGYPRRSGEPKHRPL